MLTFTDAAILLLLSFSHNMDSISIYPYLLEFSNKDYLHRVLLGKLFCNRILSIHSIFPFTSPSFCVQFILLFLDLRYNFHHIIVFSTIFIGCDFNFNVILFVNFYLIINIFIFCFDFLITILKN